MTQTRPATLLNVIATRVRGPGARAIARASVLFITVLTAAAAQISFPLPVHPGAVYVPADGGAGRWSRARVAARARKPGALSGGRPRGLPVFAASATLPPGVLRLLGPTGGYLMAYPDRRVRRRLSGRTRIRQALRHVGVRDAASGSPSSTPAERCGWRSLAASRQHRHRAVRRTRLGRVSVRARRPGQARRRGGHHARPLATLIGTASLAALAMPARR